MNKKLTRAQQEAIYDYTEPHIWKDIYGYDGDCSEQHLGENIPYSREEEEKYNRLCGPVQISRIAV